MRHLAIGVLLAVVLVAGAGAGAGTARPQVAPQLLTLNTNDRLTVAGTRLACRVVRRTARVTNRLLCFVQTSPLSFRARRGTFAVELSGAGIAVAKVGEGREIFARTELAPAGAPSGSNLAKALLTGTARLNGRQDRVFVSGTNIVCRPFGHAPNESLLCVLMGEAGRVPDGTYLVFISDRGVFVVQAQHRRAVTVFKRVNGH